MVAALGAAAAQAALNEAFKTVTPVADGGGYKIYEARR